MKPTFARGALALGFVTVMGVCTVLSPIRAQAADEAFTPAQEDAIGEIVRSYLMEHPEVIFQAADKYKTQQEAEATKKAEQSIKDNIEFLTRADAPSAGNPKGNVTIVEFFDYNCGYCKKALPDIQKLIEADKNVRVVFKEMPILGPSSRTAALWALAAHRQGKYFEFHVAVMDHKGPKEEPELEKLAKGIGLDIERLKKDVESAEVVQELEKDMQIAGQIGVQGTPAFVVGTTFIPGYVGEDGLKKAVEEARAKKTDGAAKPAQ